MVLILLTRFITKKDESQVKVFFISFQIKFNQILSF